MLFHFLLVLVQYIIIQFYEIKLFSQVFFVFVFWCLYLILCCYYYREEAEEYVNIGTINGLFVLGRSMGFIGK